MGSDRTAQADLRLCWLHISQCWKSYALAQIILILREMIKIKIKTSNKSIPSVLNYKVGLKYVTK